MDNASPKARPFSVSREEYPFTDQWYSRNGVTMHYLDEGQGLPVVMLHGNPSWSFLYRNIIKKIGGSLRSIAPDYIGFGFSDHPDHFGYTPREHAEWVEALIGELRLERFILVVQDWGGPIGLSVAVRQPEKVAGIVILNTFCWAPDARLKIFSLLFGGPIGRWLQIRFNFFPKLTLPGSINDPKHKTPEIIKAYTDQFPDAKSRRGPAVFPREIRGNDAWLAGIESKLSTLSNKPVEMVWAMKDVGHGREENITRFKKHFPAARVTRIPEANHFVQEDAPDQIAEAIKRVAAAAA